MHHPAICTLRRAPRIACSSAGKYAAPSISTSTAFPPRRRIPRGPELPVVRRRALRLAPEPAQPALVMRVRHASITFPTARSATETTSIPIAPEPYAAGEPPGLSGLRRAAGARAVDDGERALDTNWLIALGEYRFSRGTPAPGSPVDSALAADWRFPRSETKHELRAERRRVLDRGRFGRLATAEGGASACARE